MVKYIDDCLPELPANSSIILKFLSYPSPTRKKINPRPAVNEFLRKAVLEFLFIFFTYKERRHPARIGCHRHSATGFNPLAGQIKIFQIFQLPGQGKSCLKNIRRQLDSLIGSPINPGVMHPGERSGDIGFFNSLF